MKQDLRTSTLPTETFCGTDLDNLCEAHRADLAALEARLTWRCASAMLAQTLAILGAVLPIARLLE